jgi:hypothetical protein
MFITLLHRFSCVQITSDTTLYRRERENNTHSKKHDATQSVRPRERKNNNAAVTTFVIGQWSDTVSVRTASIIGTVSAAKNR